MGSESLAMALSIAQKNRKKSDNGSQVNRTPAIVEENDRRPAVIDEGRVNRSPAVVPDSSSIVKRIMEKKMASGGLVEDENEDLFDEETEDQMSDDELFGSGEEHDPISSRKDLLASIMRGKLSK